MTRKDSEKEADRPHYYSQFWLDVAAGRRVIGTPRPNEEAEAAEVEPVPPAPLRRPGRSSGAEERVSPAHAATDGYAAETIVHPVAEPVATPDEFIEPEPEITPDDDLEYQEVADEDLEAPDMDLAIDEEEEEEEFFEEEEEEEEEEEDQEWGRGRKKGKPIRPTKPAPKKTGRRDRRGGY